MSSCRVKSDCCNLRKSSQIEKKEGISPLFKSKPGFNFNKLGQIWCLGRSLSRGWLHTSDRYFLIFTLDCEVGNCLICNDQTTFLSILNDQPLQSILLKYTLLCLEVWVAAKVFEKSTKTRQTTAAEKRRLERSAFLSGWFSFCGFGFGSNPDFCSRSMPWGNPWTGQWKVFKDYGSIPSLNQFILRST